MSESPRIPTTDECFRLMAETGMLTHIAAHSIQVSFTATALADLFILRGIQLDRELIRTAALLHDITKTISLTTGEDHAATGGELLVSLGYSDVGRIVAQHVRLNDPGDSSSLPREEEIVNYSDKRVLHDRIESLDARRRYILERYGTEPTRRDMIHQMFKESFALEKRLFGLLGLAPSSLASLVASAKGSREFEAYLACAKNLQNRTTVIGQLSATAGGYPS